MSQPWCALQDRIGLQHLQRPLRRQLVGKVRAICYCNYRAVTPAGAPRHTSLDELQPPKPIWPTPPHQIALDCLGSASACMCVHVPFRRPQHRGDTHHRCRVCVCVCSALIMLLSHETAIHKRLCSLARCTTSMQALIYFVSEREKVQIYCCSRFRRKFVYRLQGIYDFRGDKI
jgi:hypothetical protein